MHRFTEPELDAMREGLRELAKAGDET